MFTPKTEKELSKERTHYYLEFAQFLSKFIVLVIVALILMQVISAYSSSLLKSSTTHTAQGSGK